MFTNDFYPTPIEVINTMCSGLDLIGKTDAKTKGTERTKKQGLEIY